MKDLATAGFFLCLNLSIFIKKSMIPISQITSPDGKTGRTLAFVALGLSIAVGIGTLVYLHHQIKLSKIKLADHKSDPAAHKKSPA